MQENSLAVKWGKLELRTLKLELASAKMKVSKVTAKVGGKAVKVSRKVEGQRVTLTFGEGVTIQAGQALEVVIA